MSTDILTQLQTTYTQLLQQFYSTASYLSQRHPTIAPKAVSGDPYTNPPIEYQPNAPPRLVSIDPGPEDTTSSPFPLRPDSPNSFKQSQRELAEDLVLKTQQIFYLIERLPGLGKGEEEQKDDIRRLVGEVEEMEKIRRQQRREMRILVERLEHVVMGMSHSLPAPATNGEHSQANGSNGHLEDETNAYEGNEKG